VLDGWEGADVLSSEEREVWNYFFGDMEAKTVQDYLHAVKNGRIVFAAPVDPKSAEPAAKLAKAGGASEVVHFGDWVITNY
jgi:hypothetical protein